MTLHDPEAVDLAGPEETTSGPAGSDRSAGSDGAGCVSGRSPQGAECIAAAPSDAPSHSASEETPRRAPGPGGTTPADPDPAATAPAGTAPAPTPAEPTPTPTPRKRSRRPVLLTTALVAALLFLALLSAGVGAYDIPLGDVLASVQHHLGLGGAPLDRVGESVLWNVRLPRVVLALLVGASLGCAGALMQGVFGNPLAEPGVIGISAGAAVGAVAAISLGLSFFGNWTITVCAFVAGLITVGSVYFLSRNGGKTEVVTLILTGIAVNAFAGALIGLFVFFADSGQVNQITFWQLGSLAQATWPKVLAVLPCALAGLLVAPLYSRRLDLLALGERPARHLGIDVERLRLALILVVALLTAAAVAVAGVITFIGLLVPHLLRMANGPGHRFLVPGSALAGALVLVAGDLAARTLAQPAELPLGVLTALLGSPFFFWLLRRTRRKQGGWA
ncbi:iron chelate uptake ABC transporter family permease subunit [Streptomyces sp. NPDC087297]|uniref:iron chelate uptake ABC transporter family permease subunit n=1 Tax=Streptomyces sp. NPDC087297 TaxID=3365778 RepID=UPI0038214F6D